MNRKLLTLFAILALVAAACGGDSDSADSEDTAATTAAPATEAPADDTAADDTAAETTAATEADMDDEAMGMPGEGTTVTMGRADWSTGYFQAAVYRQLLTELGYEVSDPSALELGPSLAYLSMAQGDFDFWVNSWYPGHISWWDPELPDGSQVGDHLTAVGPAPEIAGDFASHFTGAPGELTAGGLQGYLVTKSFADEFGLKTLDDLNNNPDALAAFDAADPVPGNGIADIYGCQESFTCDNIIQNQIAFSGWDNITQVIAGYDAMVAEAIDKANTGDPMVIYTWTPSAYITQLIPGDNVVWIGVEEVIDDSNPTGQDGGEGHDQRPGTASIGADTCPVAEDLGTCQLGWIAADIMVTANTEFLEANPAAAALFEQVQLPIIDVSLANVEQDNGRNSNSDIEALASEWIENNRATVDAWLEAAIAAG
jgi:glycine betaine/proline transport system substrate-binding protein